MNRKWMWIIWIFVLANISLIMLTSTTNSKILPTKQVIVDHKDTLVDTLVVDTVDYYEKAIEHLKHYEGFKSKVYIDNDGSKTIGYGHHLLENEKYETINESTATAILKKDFNYRLSIIKAKYNVKSTQALSLTLFSFNLGLGGLQKAINNGLLEHIESITQYCHYSTYENGIRYIHKNKRLLERREYELQLFLIN